LYMSEVFPVSTHPLARARIPISTLETGLFLLHNRRFHFEKLFCHFLPQDLSPTRAFRPFLLPFAFAFASSRPAVVSFRFSLRSGHGAGGISKEEEGEERAGSAPFGGGPGGLAAALDSSAPVVVRKARREGLGE